MTELVASKNAYVATEAARILLSVDGIFPAEGLAQLAGSSGTVTTHLALARAQLNEKMLAKRAKKKADNRRYYIRRKLKQLDAMGQESRGEGNNENKS